MFILYIMHVEAIARLRLPPGNQWHYPDGSDKNDSKWRRFFRLCPNYVLHGAP